MLHQLACGLGANIPILKLRMRRLVDREFLREAFSHDIECITMYSEINFQEQLTYFPTQV